MEFFTTPVDNIYQWLGLILTTLGTLISCFVLWQTYSLRKNFLTKIKLPEVVKLIDQNRENFNEKLVLNNISTLYTTNFIGPLSYQAFSFLKLRALS